jgi:hypothetical protein
MSKLIDLTGQKFGRLIAVRRMSNDKHGHRRWLCLCICKNKTIVRSADLENNKTQSCGCLQVEKSIKHGYARKRKQSGKYQSWKSMIQRCTNHNNKGYKDYGRKGIVVCEEWLQFKNFNKDMPGWKSGLQIDRKNNKKGYYKENCRWATRQQQMRNKRNNCYKTYKGKTQLVVEWAKEYNIPYRTLWSRLYKYGWSMEKALTTPVRKRKKGR